MDISISDVQRFLRCRRQWLLQSPMKMNLIKMGMPSAALHVGSGIHEALAAQALGEPAHEALTLWAAEERATYDTDYRAAVGVAPSPSETEKLDDAYTQATEIVRRYFARYGANPLGNKYRYVAVEQTFRVPIPGTFDGHLIGTFDGLVRDESDHIYLVEHKTFSVQPDLEKLSTNDQFTAYAWAAGALLGQPIAGILYDGIARKLPSPPVLLKTGGLSKTWKDTLDYDRYLEEIYVNDMNPGDYTEILTRLKERDAQEQTPFFTRWKLPILRSQIDTFAGYLPDIYNDMTQNPKIYPNFLWQGCWDCHVRDLCKAIQFGEDVEWMIRNGYTQGSGSQSNKRRHGVEVMVDAAAFA